MLVCVPDPVCQTESGNSSIRFRLIIWSHALVIALVSLELIKPKLWLAKTLAFFCCPKATIISSGILLFPILKFSKERWVWAPQSLLVSISLTPKLSDSVLFLFGFVCY